LGAQRTRVLRTILTHGVTVALAGIGTGSVIALALGACLGPAVRASLVDPAVALRKS